MSVREQKHRPRWRCAVRLLREERQQGRLIKFRDPWRKAYALSFTAHCCEEDMRVRLEMRQDFEWIYRHWRGPL